MIPYFTSFVFIWGYCRHFLNLQIIYATMTKFRTVGPFTLDWEKQQYKCWISQPITLTLLVSLQAVNLFWFFLILRIAKNYVMHDGLKDERSDYGSEEEEADGESTKEKRERMAAAVEARHLKQNGHAAPRHAQSGAAPTMNGGALDSPAGNTRASSRRRRNG